MFRMEQPSDAQRQTKVGRNKTPTEVKRALLFLSIIYQSSSVRYKHKSVLIVEYQRGKLKTNSMGGGRKINLQK